MVPVIGASRLQGQLTLTVTWFAKAVAEVAAAVAVGATWPLGAARG